MNKINPFLWQHSHNYSNLTHNPILFYMHQWPMVPDHGTNVKKIYPAIMEECMRTDRRTNKWTDPFPIFPNSASAEWRIIPAWICYRMWSLLYISQNICVEVQIMQVANTLHSNHSSYGIVLHQGRLGLCRFCFDRLNWVQRMTPHETLGL